jgi:hypothetical protein
MPFGSAQHSVACLAVVRRLARAEPGVLDGPIGARVLDAADGCAQEVACILEAARSLPLIDRLLERPARLQPPFLRLLRHWFLQWGPFSTREEKCKEVFRSAVESGNPEIVRAGYLACTGIVEIPLELAAEHLVRLECKAEIANLLLMQAWGDGSVIVPALIAVASELASVPLLLCRACEGGARVVLDAFSEIMRVVSPQAAFRVFLRLLADKGLKEEVSEKPWVSELFTKIASERGEDLGKELVAIAELISTHLRITQENAGRFREFLPSYLDVTFSAPTWELLEAGFRVLDKLGLFGLFDLDATHIERIVYCLRCRRKPVEILALSCAIKLARYSDTRERLREHRIVDIVDTMPLPDKHESLRETLVRLLSWRGERHCA